MRLPTLSFALLVDWIEGRLSEPATNAVAEQFAQADVVTQERIAWLQAFRRARHHFLLVSPSQNIEDALRVKFRGFMGGQREGGFFRHLIAVLTYDAWATLAGPGQRSSNGLDDARQLAYSTELADVAVDIQVDAQDKHYRVSGQIFPRTEIVTESLVAQIIQSTTSFGLTTATKTGEFVFELVPAGIYQLVLSADQFEIQIPEIELSS